MESCIISIQVFSFFCHNVLTCNKVVIGIENPVRKEFLWYPLVSDFTASGPTIGFHLTLAQSPKIDPTILGGHLFFCQGVRFLLFRSSFGYRPLHHPLRFGRERHVMLRITTQTINSQSRSQCVLHQSDLAVLILQKTNNLKIPDML